MAHPNDTSSDRRDDRDRPGSGAVEPEQSPGPSGTGAGGLGEARDFSDAIGAETPSGERTLPPSEDQAGDDDED